MIDKGLYKTRKNFRIGSKSGKDTSGRRYDRPSAPAPSTPRSSPFSNQLSGQDNRQSYSAIQKQTGAVKGGGRRVGPPGSDKYETGFVSGDDGRAARDDFIRGIQETNPGYTGGGSRIRKLPTLGQFIGGALNLLPGMGIARGIGRGLKALTNRFRQPTPDMSQFNTLGLLTDRVTPNYYNDLDNQGLLSLINEEDKENTFNRMFETDAIRQAIEKRRLEGLNTFRDPPSKEITDYQNFLTKSPDFVSFDEYQRNIAQAPRGIMQNLSEQDLDEIGEGADFVSYNKLRNMGLSDAGTTPQLGELTGFIDPLATMTARERQLKDLFSSNTGSDVAPQFQDMVMQTGINEAQKKMIDRAAKAYGRVNAASDGTPGKLDATTQKEIFDSVKPFDTKAKDPLLGFIGGQEADPMTQQEYKDYLISQGFI